MPLIDKNDKTFGVVGMGVAEDYFYKILPSSKFVEDDMLGHNLAIVDKETKKIIPILNYGNVQDEIAQLGIPLELVQ